MLFFAPVLVSAQTVVGSVIYLEGDVSIVRQGTILDSITFGETVYTNDVVRTEVDSYAEVEITGSNATGSTIRVNEDSAYYVADYDVESDTRVRLLTGSIEVAVQQLRPGSRFSVQTSTAALGVRGTTFDVITAPDETTLLGVREGSVRLEANGKEIDATTGTAVEAESDGDPSLQRVPNGDFNQYYTVWRETRLAIFKSGAPTFVQAYARRYLDLIDEFHTAYQELSPYRAQLEAAVQSQLSMGEEAMLKMEIGPALTRMRSILPIFENTVYRLRELRRFHNEGIGITTIDQMSSSDFFRDFTRQENRLVVQLSITRHIFSLYRAFDSRSFGGMPGSSMPGSSMPGSSFPGTTNF